MKACRSLWWRLCGGILAAVLATTSLPATSASAQEGSAAPEGSGQSAWGPVAPPDSANTAMLPAQPRPTWEKAVNLPYVILFFPLKLVFHGIEGTAAAVERDPGVRKFVSYFPLRAGPSLISGGLSYSTAEGFGLGVSLDVPDQFNLRLSGQTAGDRRVTTGLRRRHGTQSWFDFGAGYRNSHNARYYGVGFDAPQDAESFYRRELSWGGVTWYRNVGNGDFKWALTALYSGVAAIGSGRTDDPHLSEEFADDLPPGYRAHTEGITAGLELFHENTVMIGPPGHEVRERDRPESGGLRRASVSWFEGKGNSKAAFWTWRVEAQQFIPLWYSKRALAVRGYMSRIEDEGDDPVPFQRLLTNDDPDLFRGYVDDRFHDVGITSVSAEYRWPIWAVGNVDGRGADAYVFADWGQVFSDFDQITNDHLTKSYGGGIRIGGHGRFSGRMEVGHSEEGTQFRLRADQLFQYERGGLFNGRGPVPDR